jgi:glucose/arabinose dehydrogenase
MHRSPRILRRQPRVARAGLTFVLLGLLLVAPPSAEARDPQGRGLGVLGKERTGAPVAQLGTAAAVTGFQDTVAFSGLTYPTVVRFSPDGRVFVAEKSGLIKVFDSMSDTTPDVFADLRTNVHNFWDRGLLGLALDPQFPTVPYVYARRWVVPLPGGGPRAGRQTRAPTPPARRPTGASCPRGCRDSWRPATS